jgi:hypothetical protein
MQSRYLFTLENFKDEAAGQVRINVNDKSWKEKIMKGQVIMGTTSQEKSLPNSGAILFVPQGNPEHRTEDIYTSASTVPLAWVTARRLKREKGSLGCHP